MLDNPEWRCLNRRLESPWSNFPQMSSAAVSLMNRLRHTTGIHTFVALRAGWLTPDGTVRAQKTFGNRNQVLQFT
jgi:hypothetical protein